MDPLLEVEGSTEQIERAISATGLARDGFTSERLADFVRRYELRTGTTAVTADEVVMGASDRSASNG